MKIAFFGTSDRSIPILTVLHKNFELDLCVTRADTKVGRKLEIRETKVKKWATENNIPCLQLNSLKKESARIIAQVETRGITLGVVADFGFIITRDIINSLPKGLINVHFSLLPKYRGASPVQYAILNGDVKTGISYYLMDEKMDTGDIIYQSEYKLTGKETSEGLYAALFEKAGVEITDILNKYANGNLKPQKQNKAEATYTYSKTQPLRSTIMKNDAKINWADSPVLIERQIRAYNPWPISFTTAAELEKNLLAKKHLKLKTPKIEPLTVKIYKARIDDTGSLEIETLQIEGKKIMAWEEFKNGYLTSA